MRDRLIELLTTEIECNKDGHGDCSMCPYKYADKECERHIAELTANFLLANGIIVPPCRVGDTVWYLHQNLGEVFKAVVVSVEYNFFTKPQEWLTIEYVTPILGTSEYKSRIDLMLGKTVFLSREEAEQALAERSKG